MERQDWTAAEALLRRAVETCSRDHEARWHYAEALWHRQAQAEALEQMDQAMALDDENTALVARAAEMRLEAGQVESARALAQRAIDLDPSSTRGWAVRAKVASRSGQARQALADYHRALSLDGDDREVLLAIAELYRDLGESQRALANLHALLDSYPPGEEPPRALYLEGLAYASLGRHAEASASYSAAVERGQPTAELLYHLADAQWRAGQPQLARDAVNRALALDPSHVASRALRKQVWLAQEPDAGQRGRR